MTEQKKMKVAVAADQGSVSAHFGRCPEYVIAQLGDGQVVSTERMPNPGHDGPGQLPQLLNDLGIGCIVAGGMGARAKAIFDQMGIQCITGVSGSVEVALARLAAGELEPGEDTCEPQHQSPDCSHRARP